VLRSESNEGCDNLSKSDHELNAAAKHSPKLWRRRLGLVDWDYDNRHSGHGVGDDATDGELSGGGGGNLEGSSTIAASITATIPVCLVTLHE
jgi:hypothetical protein